MLSFKQVINHYTKYYVVGVVLLWLGIFFLPWDISFLGFSVYLFVMQKLFIVLGLIAILMAIVAKKYYLLMWGLLFIFAFWINMFILFAVLPVFGN
ncbi:hypothetical protein N1495_02425 [Streptococcus didelphis]|uniref:SpeK n=1 Tax=Streptococcus didelphis TaxID=102886 RepID=A0ABY9LFN0_9STRE|nr:hypothetical protein [Streptococcus didelphis]WMB27689.1 hypothetical protein N1496_06155 [Streptococcus didelphis]WMB29855.1 hypothetical protein N1495_02425 [Streptococcus didelphis]